MPSVLIVDDEEAIRRLIPWHRRSKNARFTAV